MLKTLDAIRFKEILVEDLCDVDILAFISKCQLRCRVLLWKNREGNYGDDNVLYCTAEELNRYLARKRLFLITKNNAYSIARAVEVSSMPFEELLRRYSYTY